MCDMRYSGGRLLRRGHTTGCCAAAAAKAAALMLLGGKTLDKATVTLPGGGSLTLDVLDIQKSADAVRCAVRKDGGDDPDVTNGILVYADVKQSSGGILIRGGEGVGRVTQPGLDQPVGEAAINSVPRKMITGFVKAACDAHSYQGGLIITISIPGGEALAKRTFNPRLGIEGGLSVIGTTGIVEPMSEKALVDTIRLELRQLAGRGARAVLFTPGNYGESFARDTLRLTLKNHVACSNFIGDAIDAAVELGFRKILLIGHIGKLVKLGIGAFNTHSACCDGRMETLLACALEAGGSLELLKAVSCCVTTDAALARLYDAGLLESAMQILGKRIDGCLARRVPEDVSISFAAFSSAGPFAGVLAKSEGAEALMEIWRRE